MDERRAGALRWLRANRDSVAKQHPNQWVAVYSERVIGADPRFDILVERIQAEWKQDDPQRFAFAFIAAGAWA